MCLVGFTEIPLKNPHHPEGAGLAVGTGCGEESPQSQRHLEKLRGNERFATRFALDFEQGEILVRVHAGNLSLRCLPLAALDKEGIRVLSDLAPFREHLGAVSDHGSVSELKGLPAPAPDKDG